MVRPYAHVNEIEKMLERNAAGKTSRDIGEKPAFKDKYVVKGWVGRQNRRMPEMEAEILPRRQEGTPKGYLLAGREKNNEIRRLKDGGTVTATPWQRTSFSCSSPSVSTVKSVSLLLRPFAYRRFRLILQQ